MARARRDSLATEVQAALHCVKEAETLLQAMQLEVTVAQLDLQEAEEHIGWIREFTRKQRLLRHAQSPPSSIYDSPSSPSSNSDEASSQTYNNCIETESLCSLAAFEGKAGGEEKCADEHQCNDHTTCILTEAALKSLDDVLSQNDSTG